MGFSLVFNVNAMLIGPFDRHKHDLDAVLGLLAVSTGPATLERLQKLIDEFYNLDGHTLYVASQNDVISGIIGVDCIAKPRGVITHIAVLPDRRMKGIGRNLISHVVKTLGLTKIEAETDQEAADFYHACGFESKEIESKWPGVRRFRCVKIVDNLGNVARGV